MRLNDILRVRRRADAFARARVELEEAIIRAHEAGYSTRTIADATNFSHETVRLIIRRGD